MKKYSIYALMGAIALAGSVGFSSCFLSGSLAHCILSHHPLAAALRTSYMDSLGQRDFPKK